MINKTALKDAYDEFHIIIKDKQGTPFTSFSEGIIFEQEGFKYKTFKEAQEKLQLARWKKTDIGSGKIINYVLDAFTAEDADTLVDFRSVDDMKSAMLKHKRESESILYDLYKNDNIEEAFDKAYECWEHRYDFMSYLMFIKDKNKYATLRRNNHKRIFELLELPTECFKTCTWENYSNYLQTMYEVKQYLSELFGMPITLIDTHSFLWQFRKQKETNEERIIKRREERKDDNLNKNLAEATFDGINPKTKKDCCKKKVKKTKSKTTIPNYHRDQKEAEQALVNVGFKCEYDNGHKSFIRKKNGRRYTEVHHLIPICFQDRFDNSLDNWVNIISLCSDCHNRIHYGKDAEKLVKKLYNERKEMLRRAGIGITLKQLLEMYK